MDLSDTALASGGRRFRPMAFIPMAWGIVVLAIIMSGCATSGRVRTAGPPFEALKTVLVLPVQDMTAIYGTDINIRSPISGRYFHTGPVEPGAAAIISDLLIDILGRYPSLQVIPPEQAIGAMSPLVSDRQLGRDRTATWMETGKAVGADAVMVCLLFRYRDRVGNRYAVDTPASVAIGLDLLSVPDARILWSGRLDETQQPLSENLFQLPRFMERKGWITAREMTRSGLDRLLSDTVSPR